MNPPTATLSAQQRRRLLALAREALRAQLAGEAAPSLQGGDPLLERRGGLFVSLHHGRRLRGCIGSFSADRPLGRTLIEMAAAAARDPRFTAEPVTLAELDRLNIELSILSELELTCEPLSLIVGVHGIFIRRGSASGCFLPQVATEMGWNPEQFLEQCCRSKAGLPAGTWQRPDTEVYLFTAEVFSEQVG